MFHISVFLLKIWYAFVALSHNTIRGASDGSLLNAELHAKKGVYSRESA